jgi:hypothetical protein
MNHELVLLLLHNDNNGLGHIHQHCKRGQILISGHPGARIAAQPHHLHCVVGGYDGG